MTAAESADYRKHEEVFEDVAARNVCRRRRSSTAAETWVSRTTSPSSTPDLEVVAQGRRCPAC